MVAVEVERLVVTQAWVGVTHQPLAVGDWGQEEAVVAVQVPLVLQVSRCIGYTWQSLEQRLAAG
jgi:hypothetical protein